MNQKLEDLKEQALEQGRAYWEKIQESNIYIQLKEKYDELPSKYQKYIKYGAAFFIVYFVLSFPLGWLGESSNSINEYQKKRKLLSNILSVQSELQSAPQAPPSVDASSLESKVKSALENMNINEEQIKETSATPPRAVTDSNILPSGIRESSLQVRIEKLNLTQVVSVGRRLQNLSPGAKLIDMEVLANKEDDHYFDLRLRLASFSLVESEEDDDSGDKKKPRRSRDKG